MISIVVPVYNEERRLGASLDRIFVLMEAHHPDFEVVVVDDGSTDATLEVARRHGGGRSNLRIESYAPNRGKGHAVRRGLEQARGEWVLFTDADLSTPIEEIEKMLAAGVAGADVVIGTRAHPQSDIQVPQPFYRDRGGKLFNAVVRLLLLPDLRDTQCGFKLLRRAALQPLLPKLSIDRFAFDVEILYVARLAGLKIVEVPVVWVHSADSRVRLSHALAAFLDVLRIRWRHR